MKHLQYLQRDFVAQNRVGEDQTLRTATTCLSDMGTNVRGFFRIVTNQLESLRENGALLGDRTSELLSLVMLTREYRESKIV